MRRLACKSLAIASLLVVAGCASEVANQAQGPSVGTSATSALEVTSTTDTTTTSTGASPTTVEASTTTVPQFAPGSPELVATPSDLWRGPAKSGADTYTISFVVNLGGCLGIQAHPDSPDSTMPMILGDFASVQLSEDGRTVFIDGEAVELGGYYFIGGRSFDRPGPGVTVGKINGPLPPGCEDTDEYFVADVFRPENYDGT